MKCSSVRWAGAPFDNSIAVFGREGFDLADISLTHTFWLVSQPELKYKAVGLFL